MRLIFSKSTRASTDCIQIHSSIRRLIDSTRERVSLIVLNVFYIGGKTNAWKFVGRLPAQT